MTSISEQFSAVSNAGFNAQVKAGFDTQLDFFNNITTQALDSAGRVAALNLAVSRDAVQRSLGAGFALANARDPRDVFTLGGQAEEQLRSLFAYGRELLGIASGLRPYALPQQALGQAAAQARKLAAETVEVVERSVASSVQAAQSAAESVTESVIEAAPEAPAAHPVAVFAPVSEPVVVAEPEAVALDTTEPLAAVAEPVPVAEPKAIAKAVGKGIPRAAAVPHPAAAPVAELAPDAGSEAPKLVAAPVANKRKK